MKACENHSGILSPKNATPRRLTSDEPDLVALPKAAEVWHFVTVFVTISRRFPSTLEGRDVSVARTRSEDEITFAQRGGRKS